MQYFHLGDVLLLHRVRSSFICDSLRRATRGAELASSIIGVRMRRRRSVTLSTNWRVAIQAQVRGRADFHGSRYAYGTRMYRGGLSRFGERGVDSGIARTEGGGIVFISFSRPVETVIRATSPV